MVAAAVIGGAVVGGVASNMAAGEQSDAAQSAANTQAAASDRASQVRMDMYNQTRGDLGYYRDFGSNSLGQLGALMGLSGDVRQSPLLSQYKGYEDFKPWDPSSLESTPGYQFTLDQGLKGVTNANSANGLIGSGAHGKALADYASGLASQTYQTQFQNYQTELNNHMAQYQLGFNTDTTQKTNIFNRLMAAGNMGQSSAAQTGGIGTQVASGIGGNIIGAGNAAAAGRIGAANANAANYNNMASGITNAYYANRLLGGSANTPAATTNLGTDSGYDYTGA